MVNSNYYAMVRRCHVTVCEQHYQVIDQLVYSTFCPHKPHRVQSVFNLPQLNMKHFKRNGLLLSLNVIMQVTVGFSLSEFGHEACNLKTM